MSLSKALKMKRDAEERLRARSPGPVYIETAAGVQSYLKTEEVATKQEIITTFAALTDGPGDYAGEAGAALVVNAEEDGLAFLHLQNFEPITDGDPDEPGLLFGAGDLLMGVIL